MYLYPVKDRRSKKGMEVEFRRYMDNLITPISRSCVTKQDIVMSFSTSGVKLRART